MDRFSGTNFVTIGGLRMFVDLNLGTNTAGSFPNALWFNGVQESLLYPVTQFGLVPSDADNTQLYQAIMGLPEGRLLGIYEYSSSGTFDPPAGMRFCVVEMIPGGSGGGGAAATTGTTAAVAGAGWAGAQAVGMFTAEQVGASQPVTIGNGGNGGVAGNHNGSVGGTSSFGSLMSVTGAFSGEGAAATTLASAQAQTIGSGNYSTVTGANLHPFSAIVPPTVGQINSSGLIVQSVGGSSPYANGGLAGLDGAAPGAAQGVGTGGGGATSSSGTFAAAAGQAGGPGFCRVRAYS